MPLIDLWQTTPEQLKQKQLQQVIAFAGSGRLKDGNDTSVEFRMLLGVLPSIQLKRFCEDCLESKFEDSGLALQDLVNEAGRRLGFEVTDGRYRGVAGAIGFDGLWRSRDGDQLVIEVKTTDAYRIGLDTIADYRRELIRTGKVDEDRSSIVIVVGRQDTGELEAQIRGSKHAWDIRLLSVDALLRLVQIREEIEGPAVARKICDLLIPREYTRVDGIIDLVFETAADVRGDGSDQIEVPEPTPIASAKRAQISEASTSKQSPKFIPVSFHDECAERVSKKLGIPLVKRSKATFISPGGEVAAICAVSREYELGTDKGFWYAFHPHQRELLHDASNAFVAFGCGSAETILLIPFRDFEPWLSGMNMTKSTDREYWHVHIHREGDRFTLHRRSDQSRIDLTKYKI